jgi:transposase
MERPRQVEDRGREVGQGRALVAAQGARAPVQHPARRARRGLAANRRLFRAFLLKEQLRLLYHLDDPALAGEHLGAWLAWASRSKLKPFVKLARTIRRHREGILSAIRLGLSNGRLEGLNSKVRLISHRSFGLHSAAPLVALVYLCCGGVTVMPPLA